MRAIECSDAKDESSQLPEEEQYTQKKRNTAKKKKKPPRPPPPPSVLSLSLPASQPHRPHPPSLSLSLSPFSQPPSSLLWLSLCQPVARRRRRRPQSGAFCHCSARARGSHPRLPLAGARRHVSGPAVFALGLHRY